MERKNRCIITGFNENGKSIITSDSPPDEFNAMWTTYGSPADNTRQINTINKEMKLEPPTNGSLFRFFQVLPDDPSISAEELEKYMAEGFAAMGAAHCRPDTTRDPRMHKTKTIDYIILLKGEVILLLDEGEVDLKPFDVVIQRGTNHAWINRSSNPALLAAILIDAKPI